MKRNREIKKGDIVTPKDFPALKDRVEQISDFLGTTVYTLANKCRYTEDELENN